MLFKKGNFTTKNLLYNRGVLYFFVFITVIDLFYFVTLNDMLSITLFILIGLLTSFFNKNMIVILFISIVFTHILKYGTNIAIKEGMEDGSNDDSTEKEESNGKPKMKKEEYEKIKKDLNDFLKTQEKILGNLKEIDPLLTKAETFIERWEDKYKKELEAEKQTNEK